MKAASEEQIKGAESKLDAAHYADIRQRKFPCHTPAATWASYAFLLYNRERMPEKVAAAIEERLDHYVKVHRVGPSIQQLKLAHAESLKKPDDSKLPDDSFAMVEKTATGTIRHMRLAHAADVKAAAAYLLKWRDEFKFTERQMAAERIYEKAAEFGVRLPAELNRYIVKQAGYGACSAAQVAELIRSRVGVSRVDPKSEVAAMQQELLKFAAMIEKESEAMRRPGMRTKVAEVLDNHDRAAGLLDDVRADRIRRIEDVLFSVTGDDLQKYASEQTMTTTGSIYRLDEITKLALSHVRALLGDDIADALSDNGLHISADKAAEIIPTLDRECASRLDDLMTSRGFGAIAKEAGVAVRIGDDYIRECAARHRESRTRFY